MTPVINTTLPNSVYHAVAGQMNPLFRELLIAHRMARLPELADVLEACGLPIDSGPVFGLAFVEIDAHNYVPAAGGEPAVIVPLFGDDGLLDLVATGLKTRSTCTRAGVATVLGQEWIDHARETETAVRLFADPIAWLRAGRRGAVVVDWRSARTSWAISRASTAKTTCSRSE